MLSLLIFLAILVILSLLFLINLRLFTKVHQRYVDACKLFQNSTIPFTYFINKDIIEFKEKSFIFNYSKNITFDEFIDKIISLNQKEVKFWFKNIFKVTNDKNNFIVEIKIDRGSQMYELRMLNYSKNDNKIYFCLNLIKSIGINNYYYYKNANNNTWDLDLAKPNSHYFTDIFEFINHIKDSCDKTYIRQNGSIKNNLIIAFQIVDNLSMGKYYIYNFNKSIINLVNHILKTKSIHNVVSCLDFDNQYLLYSQGKFSDEKIISLITKIYDHISKNLSQYCVALDFSIHFGVFKFNKDILAKMSIQEIIDYTKVAYKQALSENNLYKLIDDKNYFVNLINLEQDIINYCINNPLKINPKILPIENLLTKNIEAYICHLDWADIDVANNLQNKTVFDILLLINNIDLAVEAINSKIKNNHKGKDFIITMRFSIIFHNISDIIAKLKKIQVNKLVISITHYAFYDYTDIKWCFEHLQKNNIHCSLYNFKLFNNAITLINKLNLRYVFLSDNLLNELMQKKNRQIQIKTLINQGKNINTSFVIKNINSFNEALVVSLVGVKYSYGEIFQKLNYDKKQYLSIYEYYIRGQNFKLNIEEN